MKKLFQLQRTFKIRDKIINILRPYISKTIIGETVKDLTSDVYRVLPPATSYDALFETCRCLAGQELSARAAAEFSWRVAGNIENLFAGKPVAQWGRQIADEWMPVQILRLDPAFRRGRSGFMVQFRALAGSYCPGVFEQFLSRASCAAIARIIGFSRTRPYTHNSHLTNLRLAVLVEAARSIDAPHFKEVMCTTAMTKHNVAVIEIRVRNKPCPYNYDHLCENCALGYFDCPAAIFQQALVNRHCDKCDGTRAFDLNRSAEMCLSCWQTQQAAQYDKAGS